MNDLITPIKDITYEFLPYRYQIAFANTNKENFNMLKDNCIPEYFFRPDYVEDHCYNCSDHCDD